MTRSILKFFFLMAVFFGIAGISAYLTLTLVIESEETVVVPELEGKNAINVLELLSDLGLNTKVRGSEYSPEVPRHHVIYQDPEPGTMIKKGRDVKVVLSKGSQTLAMPNLTDLPRQQAEVILANNGIESGVITRTYSQTIKKDYVIAHTPAAGRPVKRNEPVDLLISLGPRPTEYVMPDIEGMGLEEAVQIIEQYGLTLGEIRSVYHEDQAANIIIDQKPFSGYHVQPDQEVDLSVNRWHRKKGPDSSYSDNGEVLFRHQLPPGILKQHIRVELNAFGTSSVIYDELMAPGREIWVMVPRHFDAAVFLYQNEKLIRTEIY
ncbi:MAG: PASTA domain-containing protein [Desulfobacterales bacterium]|nr:PASTA domain-containing protein [Desulfobacterales bacterium]